MSVYVDNILAAAIAFPFLAALATLPYLVYQYRKFGSVPWLRTLVVYSFAFYLLCAYFLVLLPLPADRTAFVPYAATPQLVPFHFVSEIAQTARISPTPPRGWASRARPPSTRRSSTCCSPCPSACTCATTSGAVGGRCSCWGSA